MTNWKPALTPEQAKADDSNMTDIEFAKHLLEFLGPDLREAGYTATADDVEEAGHRLLHSAEIVHTMFDGNPLNDLQEVRIEISRVNEAAGQTVFNPAATEALDSVIKDLS